MKQNKTLSFLSNWWVPFSFWAFTFIFYNIGELAKIDSIRSFSDELLWAGIIALLFSTIHQFAKKKWIPAIVSAVALCGTVAFFFFIAIFQTVTIMIDGDHWADDLTIPSNIQLDTPINLTMGNDRPVIVYEWKKDSVDFQLYNSFQPGLYEYDFWVGNIEPGTIYLKAFEITQNYALSTSRLKESTSLKISNPARDIVKFKSPAIFTIYEGDWGKPYAARFEVWFKPADGGKQRKLLEKNYKIEGWMH